MKFTRNIMLLVFASLLMLSGCKKDNVEPTSGTPSVSGTTPGASAVGVALNSTIIASFTTAMNASTATAATFTLSKGSTPVAGTVSYSGTIATFTPTSPLEAGTEYTATVTTGFKNAAGVAIATNKVWTFTTVGVLASSTDPLSNATGVSRNKKIGITFSTTMNPATITTSTFTLLQGSTPVAGTVAYSGTTATFTPTNIMAASTVYTATVTTGAKNTAGDGLAANKVWSFTTGGSASTLAVVNLGAAGNYVILAKTMVSNVPTSAVTGDVGLSPAAASFVTGFALTDATGYATSSQVTGKVYAADQAAPTPINLTTAVSNMEAAYTDAAGRVSPDFVELATGNIGGLTLTPGLYKWTNTVTMPSSITISGSATDVWIFQIAGDLTVSNAVNITLSGGALPQNIFWQVAGTVSVGTTAHFEGVILSKTGITLKTGASMKGRALAQTAVILDANAVTKPN